MLGPQVAAWDNVFGQASIDLLQAAVATAGMCHKLYDRAEPPRTALEFALNSILSELDDDSPLVEYWGRQEWKHIEAHVDVDEGLAAQTGLLRFPRHAHVLYLQVQLPRPNGVEASAPAAAYVARCSASAEVLWLSLCW